MKDFKSLKEVVTAMVLSVVPVIVLSIAKAFSGENLLSSVNIIVTVFAYIISAILLYFINKYVFKLKCFRKYKKFEGKWIEIIPGFSRQISICELKYKNGCYHFDGENFYNETKSVKFNSIDVVEHDNYFYYITDTTEAERCEGLGKVYFHNYYGNGIKTANGYFVDVNTSMENRINKAHMIKIDENFCQEHLKHLHLSNINDMRNVDIYKLVKPLDIINKHLKSGEKV